MPASANANPNGAGGAEGEDAAAPEQATPSIIKAKSKAKSKSKSKSKSKNASASRVPVVTPAKIEAERVALVSEKQAQLVGVLDQHDDLVREMFHMETFLMMVDYNPEVAKQDESQVFRNYKSRYDLLETAAPVSASSPRKTRSSHTGGLLSLAGPSAAGPSNSHSNSISAPLPRSSFLKSPTKIKLKPVVDTKTPPPEPTPANEQLSINGKGKGKGKGKEKEKEVAMDFEAEGGAGTGAGESKPSEVVYEWKIPPTRILRKRPGEPDTVEPPPDAASQLPRKRRKIDASSVSNADFLNGPNPYPPSVHLDGRFRRGTPRPPEQATTETQPTQQETSISAPLNVPPNGRVLRGKPRPPEQTTTETQPTHWETSISAPLNGRVLRGKPRPPEQMTTEAQETQPPPSDPTVGGKTTAAGGRVMPHRSAAHRPQVSAPPLPHRRVAPPTPSGVKRVKLLVRRPAPKHLSHPAQRPPPPQFNSSLGAFLGSWIGLAGQTFAVTTPDPEASDSAFPSALSGNAEVARLAEMEAALWERVDAMKRAGRWFGSDLFDAFRTGGVGSGAGAATEAAGVASGSGGGTPFDASASVATVGGAPDVTAPAGGVDARPQDVWASVVRAVMVHGRRNRGGHSTSTNGNPRARKTRGAVVAGLVAAKIQAYWDGEAAKLEKGRVLEERRLRGVAKSVMKLVAAEWKKAVFHIREQERLKLEAEELKRGHEHLDAILDQSGQILETQRGDFTRGAGDGVRSRSSSIAMGWGEEEEEEEDADQGQEEEEEEEEGENEEGEGEGDEDEDEDEQNPPKDSLGADIEAGQEEEEEEEEGIGDQALSQTDRDTDMGEGEDDPSTSAALLGDFPQTPGSVTASLPDPSTPASTSKLDPRSHSLGPSALGENDSDDEDDIAVEDMMREPVDTSPIKQPRPESAPPTVVSEPHSPIPPDDLENLAEQTVANDRPYDVDSVSPNPASPNLDAPDLPASPPAEQDATMVAVENGTADMEVDRVSAREAEGSQKEEEEEEDSEEERPPEPEIPAVLKPYAVAPVEWDATKRVTPPLLLRGILRPYQQSGLEWLASLHLNRINGILADEMGLGKTIQTISLLAHLACDRGIWGPHLIIVPTSVLLNWEMEFKKFLPGFRILSYHGSTKRRKELRQGWNEKHHFNVCITSYTLASRDAVIFKRKPWYYMILDEAHMIKNFRSQRWSTLLSFRSFRRLLLTGTPLQNNLTELWALLQFLMSGQDFANLKEFGEWFSTPLEKAIEAGSALDEDTKQRVSKLHQVLRPHLLRRLKRDVEKELPSKYEHLVLCPLSKRQRFLYDEFMSRAHTRDALQSGVYQKIANILMQLRKVCNHPDLFEVRPIVTSFAMERSAIADFEIKELLFRRRLHNDIEETVNMDLLGFRFIDRQGSSLIAAQETRRLDGTTRLPFISEIPSVPPPKDTRTIAGFRAYTAHQQRAATISRWAHIGYLNRLRCNSFPIYASETLNIVQQLHQQLLPLSAVDTRTHYFDTAYLVNAAIKSYVTRADEMAGVVDRFAFVTPAVVALDLPRIALAGYQALHTLPPDFDAVLHRASVKLQIAFPAPSLLQYDCGKLQQLAQLLREKKAGGHRVLIFTQMTKILDILEIFLNFHGYLYLRLDGATRIEDRQYITERFNADPRVFCFIASSRSGGVGINLTGADTVVFYDSDFNPQMDRQCEDRAHRIGQIRDVHIYRFVSQHTVEEAMLRKANQKRSLDDLVIQKGEFDWRSLFADDGALASALGEFDDTEDARAAALAAREAVVLEGQDRADFLDGEAEAPVTSAPVGGGGGSAQVEEEPEPEPEEGGSVADYMIAFVQRDVEFFREWKL
ncbi:SNF2 family N-terminal domain-containing protein [Mycena galericulata]|nr:SNF2 family N-terminal domain-containing protein [Mycena galericulata]